jgi:inhibitor of KinA
LTESYEIFPLGDNAITIDYGNIVDENVNQRVIALAKHFLANPFEGMIETIPAYSSLTIFYDVVLISRKTDSAKTVFDHVVAQAEMRLKDEIDQSIAVPRFIRIPACYDPQFALDMDDITSFKFIRFEEFIDLHSSKIFHVYLVGFLPGFAYMGELPEKLAMPRRPQPRQNVEPGSIGIAGKQTGIYPMQSPGGWQIVGRTPLKIFDPSQLEPVLLRQGDKVKFIPISVDEFNYIAQNPDRWQLEEINS